MLDWQKDLDVDPSFELLSENLGTFGQLSHLYSGHKVPIMLLVSTSISHRALNILVTGTWRSLLMYLRIFPALIF